MSLSNNITSISLPSVCLRVKMFVPLLQSGSVPASCHGELESELAPMFSKTRFHALVCLLPPQNTTLCKLFHLI